MVLFTMRVTPSARQRQEVLRALRFFAGSTSSRRGCLGAHILQDVENRSVIVWMEEWESEPDVARHISSDEYRKLLAVIDMSMSEPEVRFHTVTRTAGMELIAAHRPA